MSEERDSYCTKVIFMREYIKHILLYRYSRNSAILQVLYTIRI
jgi:hypothetical protein